MRSRTAWCGGLPPNSRNGAATARSTRVIVTAAGERAFSAGGDLRQIYEARRAGRDDEALAFWRDEYALNAAIKRYPEALCGADRRHRDGRRRRRVGARLAPCRRRSFSVRDAGGRASASFRTSGRPGSCRGCPARSAPSARSPANAWRRRMQSRPASPRIASLRRALPSLPMRLCGTVPVDAILAAFAEADTRDGR